MHAGVGWEITYCRFLQILKPNFTNEIMIIIVHISRGGGRVRWSSPDFFEIPLSTYPKKKKEKELYRVN
jgi:hypothetical protein